MIKKRKSRLFWTLEKCKFEALKYKTKIEWIKNSESSYKSALNYKWIDICSKHMDKGFCGIPRKYTKEQCINIANQFKSREEWKKNHITSYKSACLAGWYYDCVKKLPKQKGIWNNLENCKQSALKYTKKAEWRNMEPSAYTSACKNKWLELCCKHMIPYGGTSKPEQDILNIVKDTYNLAKSKRFIVKDSKYVAKCFELDIYIPELNKGIEFDGKYWHTFDALQKRFPKWKIEDVKNYHELKDGFFKTLNIDVIHIQEINWLKNKQLELDKISTFIGLKES